MGELVIQSPEVTNYGQLPRLMQHHVRYLVCHALIMVTVSCKNLPHHEQSGQYAKRISECRLDLDSIRFRTVGESEFTTSYFVPIDCIIGCRLPNFTLTSIDNKVISRENCFGKIGILSFWFTACEPCRREIPKLNKLAETYGHQHVKYIAVAMDNRQEIISFLANTEFKFEHVADGLKTFRETFHSLWSFPVTIIFNKEGRIIYAHSGVPPQRALHDLLSNELRKS